MQRLNKPTIWRYLIWGLIIGGIGSIVVVNIFMSREIAKMHLFQQIFGSSFSYEATDLHGNTHYKEYYEYIIQLLVIPIIGIIMGLSVGIPTNSGRKIIFSVLAGLLISFVIPYFYSDLVIEPFFNFFDNIPNLLFWYAVVITLVMSFIDIIEKNRNFINVVLTYVLSLIASYFAIMIISLIGSLAGAMVIGLGFAGSKSIGIPYIFVGIFAVALLNVTINLGEWIRIDQVCK